MGGKVPTRAEAWDVLCQWTENVGLRGHGLAVEAAMREYALRMGEDVELWGAIGLLHDFDYERYPEAEDHPFKGAEELRRLGYDDDFVETIVSHASYSGIPRTTPARKVLFAVDELSGLVVATALVMPGRSMAEVTPQSVIKKMKSKGFARKVNREEIRQGAEELGVPLEEHVATVVAALQKAAPQLGL